MVKRIGSQHCYLPTHITLWSSQVTEAASKAHETTSDVYHAARERAEAAVQAARERVRHAGICLIVMRSS